MASMRCEPITRVWDSSVHLFMKNVDCGYLSPPQSWHAKWVWPMTRGAFPGSRCRVSRWGYRSESLLVWVDEYCVLGDFHRRPVIINFAGERVKRLKCVCVCVCVCVCHPLNARDLAGLYESVIVHYEYPTSFLRTYNGSRVNSWSCRSSSYRTRITVMSYL